MSIKNEANKIYNNAKDTLSEANHRSQAEAEQEVRDELGDELSPGEKLNSVANQVKNNVQAGVDHAKRDVRNNT